MHLLRLSLLLVCVAGSWASTAVPAPRYVINLDLAAKDRWSHVLPDYKEDLQSLLKQIEKMVPPEVVELAALIGDDVEKYVPYPYSLEMVGLSVALDVALGDVLLGNMIYEVTAFNRSSKPGKACTSIVAEAVNGTIYHGRNLDLFLTDALRNMTITADFQSGGKTIYTGTTFVGYVGLVTGQKPNGYTITLDERDTGDWWMNALEAIVAGTHGVAAFLIRDTLADPFMDFEEAIENLANKPLIAPCYIIVGGVGRDQGAVITRDRDAAMDIWRLRSFDNQWFLVETNYDHWEPAPKSDDRRDPAIKGMNETGQANLNTSSLFHVLSTPSVMSHTLYTATMAASIPELYNAWIQNP